MHRHRHQEFIRFLNAVEREVLAGKTRPMRSSTTTLLTSIPPCAPMAGAPSALDVPPSGNSRPRPPGSNAVEGFFARPHEKRAVSKTRRLPICRRPPGRHQPLPRRITMPNRSPSIGSQTPTKSSLPPYQTRASSVRSDPLAMFAVSSSRHKNALLARKRFRMAAAEQGRAGTINKTTVDHAWMRGLEIPPDCRCRGSFLCSARAPASRKISG